MRIVSHQRPSYAFCKSVAMIFFIFGMTCITQSDLSGPGFPINRPTVCVTGAGAAVDSAWEQYKLEARKMLENTAESPASSAPNKYRGRSFFPRETVQQRPIDELYSGDGRSGGRTTHWRHVWSQSRGAPWSLVKLIYPLAARGERPR